MKNSLETRLGLFVALIAIAAVLILETLGSFEQLKQGKRLHAFFNTAQQLKEGDRVKMAGVEIGRVEKIQITHSLTNALAKTDSTATNSLTYSKVKVTMKLNVNALVKTDSTATIQFAGLMGQNFVSLDFGTPSAPLADDNTAIPTAEQPDLNVVMQRLDNVAMGVENFTKNFSGDTIQNILGPLTDFFVDLNKSTNKISSTMSNIATIATEIAAGKGTLGKLIMDDTLYYSTLTTITNLQSTGDDLKLVLADARAVVADARVGKGSLGKLLTDDALYNETTASMTNLKEILQKVNRGQGTVGKLVNEDEFYKNAKLTLQKLDKATESLEDQGPISVMGILFSTFY